MNKKMRNQRVGGRSLFYHRDSTGRHDYTPGQQTTNCQGASADEEIKTAFALLEKLDRYSESAGDYCGMRKVFELTNLKLFLRFEAAEWGKRTVQRLASGTITLGETPPPRTNLSRQHWSQRPKRGTWPKTCNCHGGSCNSADGKDDSLGNKGRGDRTAIELFTASVAAWDSGLRRCFAGLVA
jgi:hypothetical protein